jgi:hypothetical protein
LSLHWFGIRRRGIDASNLSGMGYADGILLS